jgi:hypothetical protein
MEELRWGRRDQPRVGRSHIHREESMLSPTSVGAGETIRDEEEEQTGIGICMQTKRGDRPVAGCLQRPTHKCSVGIQEGSMCACANAESSRTSSAWRVLESRVFVRECVRACVCK